MKRFLITVLMILVLGVSVSYAQKNQPFIRFHAGVAVPVTPEYFKDYKSGFTGGACFGVSISEKKADLYASVDYSENDGGHYTGGLIKIWAAFVNGKVNYMVEEKVSPYFVIGAGYFQMRSKGYFGAHGSLGVSISINEKVSLLIEGDYVYGATGDNATGIFNARTGVSFTL